MAEGGQINTSKVFMTVEVGGCRMDDYELQVSGDLPSIESHVDVVPFVKVVADGLLDFFHGQLQVVSGKRQCFVAETLDDGGEDAAVGDAVDCFRGVGGELR